MARLGARLHTCKHGVSLNHIRVLCTPYSPGSVTRPLHIALDPSSAGQFHPTGRSPPPLDQSVLPPFHSLQYAK